MIPSLHDPARWDIRAPPENRRGKTLWHSAPRDVKIGAVVANLLEQQSPEARATVLIVDDHSGFRTFVRRLLEAGGFDVVGEAAGVVEARDAVPALQPKVVLLDVNLPDGDGLQLAEELTDAAHPPAVVLISSHERSDFGDRLERTGARGFISKADLTPAAVADLVDP